MRHNCLKALIEHVKAGFLVIESHILEVCTILADESVPELVQPLYKLIECWVQINHTIPPALAEATFDLTQRRLNEKKAGFIDSGTHIPPFELAQSIIFASTSGGSTQPSK